MIHTRLGKVISGKRNDEEELESSLETPESAQETEEEPPETQKKEEKEEKTLEMIIRRLEELDVFGVKEAWNADAMLTISATATSETLSRLTRMRRGTS